MQGIARAYVSKLLVAFIFSLAVTTAQAAEKITFYHFDALGSPVAATNEQGNVVWRKQYQPYGEETLRQPAANSDTRGFTGHVQDSETGLIYAGARYLDPVIGRFMAIDPKGVTEGNPHSFNRYAYGNNNPYLYVDPDGRDAMITIERDTYTPNSISGSISVTSDRVANSFAGYTLETARAGDNGNKSPISPGMYDSFVRTDHSPNRVELNDVPGFTNVQIHKGNRPVPQELRGCFAVGTERSKDEVSDSANALNKVLDVIKADQRATFGTGKITTRVIGPNSEPPPTMRRLGLD